MKTTHELLGQIVMLEMECRMRALLEASAVQVEFVNEAPTATVFGFINEIAIGADGWAMICPYGDHPSEALIDAGNGKLKRQKAIQRITKASAETMVAQFHNSRKGLRKFLRGVNIYVGHPDVPGLEARYPDKEPKGVFADMETREDGIYGLPVFTNEGSEIVEQKKLRAFSGRLINSVPDGEKNGVPVYCPTEICSVGLTNNPHLPVHFFNSDDTLAEAPAEAEKRKHQTTMKKKLIALCATLGIQFANEADDAATEAALDQVNSKVAAFANEQTSLKQKLLKLCARVGITFANEAQITDPAATLVQVEERIGTLATERDTARTQFANERKARIEDAIGSAITGGRITEAERAQWQNRLNVEAQFANELQTLAALKPTVKTQSVITAQRGGREVQIDISNPQARTQFVNEAMDEVAAEMKLDRKKDHQRIFNTVQQRHPALFASMQQPEPKGGKK